jgi:multiple sugar transport system substrate-binding protein
MRAVTAIGLGLLAAGGALAAAACGTADASSTATVRVWAFGREGEVVEQLMPEFERLNPGVRVEVQQIPWTAAHEKLLTAYVGDATPDVVPLGNTWVPEFVALGALEPLEPWLRRSSAVPKGDYFPGIWDTNVVDSVVYGVPWYVDTHLIYYRTDLLAKAGYSSPPATWDAWMDAMRKIKANTGGRGYAVLVPTNEWRPPVILGVQTGSPLLKDDGRYGAFSDPAFRRAFQFYVDLYRGGLAPTLSTTEIANLFQEFTAGTFAMYISGPWYIGEFSRRLPPEMQDKWMTAPMPAPPGDSARPGVSLAGGASLVIFRASQQKEAAWKLIEYLSQPQQQTRFYELTGDLPARLRAWEGPALAENKYARAFREQLQRVVPTPKVPEWESIATKIYEHGETAIRGGASVDQALAALDRDVNQILEKRRWMMAQAAERAAERRGGQ